jgi:UDP-N-acetylglucosamine 2-epimerase (non-hydrolysing)
MRLLVPVGTRPEIVKLAPVVAELRRRGHDLTVLATGQHDLPTMADQFFSDLALDPDLRFTLPPDPHERLGALLAQLDQLLETERARLDAVLVLGDTWTVPLVCLAARRVGLAVCHLEAGLRSWNPTSMEETNRKVAAACASLHLAPTALAGAFLRAEGVDPNRIVVVGNPVIDALVQMQVRPSDPASRRGVLLTAHRATNVDDPDRLASLVRLVRRLGERLGPVTFPVHPRTASRLTAAGLWQPLRESRGVVLTDPLPYPELLAQLASSQVAVTDSGGIQEEAAWLAVPVVVLRRTTPRWEGVLAGTTTLVGLDVDRALDAAVAAASPTGQARAQAAPCPYGDGTAATRTADAVEQAAAAGLLDVAEPPAIAVPEPVRAAAASLDAGLGGSLPATGPVA